MRMFVVSRCGRDGLILRKIARFVRCRSLWRVFAVLQCTVLNAEVMGNEGHMQQRQRVTTQQHGCDQGGERAFQCDGHLKGSNPVIMSHSLRPRNPKPPNRRWIPFHAVWQ